MDAERAPDQLILKADADDPDSDVEADEPSEAGSATTRAARGKSLAERFVWIQLPVLAVVAAIVAVVYVSNEQWYYGSDYSFYHVMTWFTKKTVMGNLALSPFIVWLSTGTAGHDVVFTVGLLPFSMIFGDSRAAFIAAIAVMYLAPYVFLHGLIARNVTANSSTTNSGSAIVSPINPIAVQWTTALIALSIPTLWAPTLRGYPDVGAAAIVIVCVLLYLRDMDGTSRRRLILIGFLLGLTPLFRRHYVYAAFAFAAATVVHALIACLLARKEEARSCLLGWMRKILTIGISGALTLSTLGFFFIQEKVKHFYMYAGTSASVSFTEAVGYFITAYGAIAWVCAIAGFVMAFGMNLIDRNKGAFLVLFGMSSALTWIVLAQQMATHYTLYATPFIVWGLSLFVLSLLVKWRQATRQGNPNATATERKDARAPAICAVLLAYALYAAFNLVIAFTAPDALSRGALAFVQPSDLGMLSFPRKHGNAVSRLFSANYAPLRRNDTEAVQSFVRELQKLAQNDEPILIGDSSDLLHRDMIENVERQLNGGMSEHRLKLWGPPYLNSRDSYPLERILSSRYAAIGTRFYPYYNEADAYILKLLVSSFLDNKPITGDFEKLPTEYQFDRDITIRLYKRVRATPASSAIVALEEFKKALPRRPGGQPPWISTDDPSEQDTEETRDSFEIEPCKPGGGDNLTHYLLSAHDLPEHFIVTGKVAGRLDAAEKRVNRQYGTLYDDMPAGYALVCRLMDRNGRQLDEMKMPELKARASFAFAVPFEQRNAANVVLSVEDAKAPGDLLPPPYKIKLESLKISPSQQPPNKQQR